jgi:hypothetical protein
VCGEGDCRSRYAQEGESWAAPQAIQSTANHGQEETAQSLCVEIP